MSKKVDFGEPWTTSVSEFDAGIDIRDKNDELLSVGECYDGFGFDKMGAERVVACVNACAGIETEELRPNMFHQMLKNW